MSSVAEETLLQKRKSSADAHSLKRTAWNSWRRCVGACLARVGALVGARLRPRWAWHGQRPEHACKPRSAHRSGAGGGAPALLRRSRLQASNAPATSILLSVTSPVLPVAVSSLVHAFIAIATIIIRTIPVKKTMLPRTLLRHFCW